MKNPNLKEIPKPILSYNEFLNHNGVDMEILGETFAEPVKRSETSYYTKISVINCEFGEIMHNPDGTECAFYFPNLSSEDALREGVRAVKSNEQYLPK